MASTWSGVVAWLHRLVARVSVRGTAWRAQWQAHWRARQDVRRRDAVDTRSAPAASRAPTETDGDVPPEFWLDLVRDAAPQFVPEARRTIGPEPGIGSVPATAPLTVSVPESRWRRWVSRGVGRLAGHVPAPRRPRRRDVPLHDSTSAPRPRGPRGGGARPTSSFGPEPSPDQLVTAAGEPDRFPGHPTWPSLARRESRGRGTARPRRVTTLHLTSPSPRAADAVSVVDPGPVPQLAADPDRLHPWAEQQRAWRTHDLDAIWASSVGTTSISTGPPEPGTRFSSSPSGRRTDSHPAGRSRGDDAATWPALPPSPMAAEPDTGLPRATAPVRGPDAAGRERWGRDLAGA